MRAHCFVRCSAELDRILSVCRSAFTPQFVRSLHGCPRGDKIDSCILEIAQVACHQYSTVRAGHGGDLAVGFSDGPTSMAAAGCNLCVGSGGRAVERQNPIGEA